MGGLRMPSVKALGYDRLDTALPSWMTLTRGAGSWSRQTAPAVDGTTFIATGTSQNTARFDYGDTAGRSMLLVEPTRTNLGLDTNFVDAGADNIPDGYANNAGVAGVDYTVVAGGPHGGVTMNLLDTATNNRGRYRAGAVLPAGSVTVGSVWARRTGAGAAALYMCDQGGVGTVYCSIGAAAHDWTRFQVSATQGGVDGGWVGGLAVQGDPAGIVETACPQAETGDCATSWIPTTAAAVARAAELCAIDPGVVGANQGYVSFLWRPDYASTTALSLSPVLLQWAPNWELYFDPADDKLKLTVDSAAGAESAALTFARQGLLHVAVRYGTFGTILSVDGVKTTDPSAWGAPALAPYLGSRAASANCRPSAYGDLLFGAA